MASWPNTTTSLTIGLLILLLGNQDSESFNNLLKITKVVSWNWDS